MKRDHTPITLLAFALVAAVPLVLAATTRVTETPAGHILHAADGTTHEYATHEECAAAAQALFAGTSPEEKSKCFAETDIAVEGVCPPLPTGSPVLGNTPSDGVAQPCPGDDTRWYTQNTGWAARPFPACAAVALVPEATDAAAVAKACGYPDVSPAYVVAPGDGFVPPVEAPK